MPAEKTYQQQTSPQAGTPLPMASAATYGAGLGAELQQAGQSLHVDAVRMFQVEQKRKQDSELADFNHNFAQYRTQMGEIVRTKRSIAPPGAAGHARETLGAYDAGKENILGLITDPEVRRHAEAQWDQYRTGLADSEGGFEEGKRVAKVVTDTSDAIELDANGIRHMTGEDPNIYAASLKRQFETIDRLNVDGDTKKKLKDYADEKLATGFIQHLQDTNPAAARALLDSGTFDHLPSNLLEQLRSGADVEIRRLEAKAEHEAAVARAQFNEQVATLTERASQGIDVGKEAQVLIPQAQAAGDTSTVEKLKGIARDSAYARVYSGQPPVQREARVAALTKILPSKRSEDQQAELKWLTDHRGSLDERFNSDPVGFAIEHGSSREQPPSIENGLAARQAWARSQSQAYGRPVPVFTKVEADQLRAKASASPKGLVEVADLIGRDLSGREAIQAAVQVGGDKTVLQQLVLLDPVQRREFQNGQDVRQGNRKLVDGEAGNQALEEFNRQVGRALMLVPPSQRNAAFEVSRAIYANRANLAGAEEFDRRDYVRTIEDAIGYKLIRLNGEPVALPKGYSERLFLNTLNAYEPKRAELAPVFPDGRQMTGADVRKFIPRLRPDGLYEFWSAGGSQVKRRDGNPFVMGFSPVRK